MHTASQPKEVAKPAGVQAVLLLVGESRDEFEAVVRQRLRNSWSSFGERDDFAAAVSG